MVRRREELLRKIKFGRLRQVRNITRVDDERGLLDHAVHDVDGLRQGAVNIRIGFFVKADVGVADLHEQRLAELGGALSVTGRYRQINRREHPAGQRKKGSGPAVGHAFESVATRKRVFIIRHIPSP